MTGRAWTDEELGLVQDRPDWPTRRLAAELGRTKASVNNIRRKLARGWTPVQEAWTADEDDILLTTPWFTAEQQSQRLVGRTPVAVRRRRERLGIEALPVTKEPTHVGARPLVAKTCLTCGKLLQASWFQFHSSQRRWFPSCKRCTNDATQARNVAAGYPYRKTKEHQDANQRASKARLEAITAPRATRHRELWTEADHQTLADPDLTILQKALRLGRTHNATASMCQRNGYRSHVGLGEPTDEWRIFNPNELVSA